MLQGSPQPRPIAPDSPIVVDVCAPGEWIVGMPACGRSLHVYRLARGDWLVSEVGRESEGRGTNLREALKELSVRVAPRYWWALVVEALEEDAGALSRKAPAR